MGAMQDPRLRRMGITRLLPGACLGWVTLVACASSGPGSFMAFDPVTADPDASEPRMRPDAQVGPSPGDTNVMDADAGAASSESECGDGACDSKETCTGCAADCGACAASCGDDECNAGETCTSCAFDCGSCAPGCGDGACNGIETCTTCESDCGACAPSCSDGMCNGDETCTSCPGDCGACPPPCGELRAERALGPSETVTSCDGRFVLVMQTDGNLVLYQGSAALWSSDTSGTGANRAVMQSDGNFVVYDPTRARWASGTDGNPGAWLALQNDGNAVVYTAAGSAVWDSGTSGK